MKLLQGTPVEDPNEVMMEVLNVNNKWHKSRQTMKIFKSIEATSNHQKLVNKKPIDGIAMSMDQRIIK